MATAGVDEKSVVAFLLQGQRHDSAATSDVRQNASRERVDRLQNVTHISASLGRSVCGSRGRCGVVSCAGNILRRELLDFLAYEPLKRIHPLFPSG